MAKGKRKRSFSVENQFLPMIFQNPLILENIAEHCSVETLKSFRLINKAAYRASKLTWNRESVRHVGSYSSLKKASLKDLMEKEETPPLRNEKFWDRYGAGLKYLHLQYCSYNQLMLLNIILKFAPNVETLIIDQLEHLNYYSRCDISTWDPQVNLKTLKVCGFLPFGDWSFLLAFPKLESIELGFHTLQLVDDLVRLRRENGNHLHLKTLDIIHTMEIVDNFRDARLSLYNFTLNLTYIKEYLQAEVLGSQCRTLISLKLFRSPRARKVPIYTFPFNLNFPLLKELELLGRIASNLNFLYWMPTLEKVKIDFRCKETAFSKLPPSSILYCKGRAFAGDLVLLSDLLLKTENYEHIRLKEFVIDYEFNVDSLKIFARWTPKLRLLSCVGKKKLRPILRNNWQELEMVVAI